jgi:DNA replication protein DnaC
MIPTEVEEMGQTYQVLRMCWYERQEREQSRIARLFSETGVPQAYESDSWEHYDVNDGNREAVAKAKIIAKNKGRLGDSNKSLLIYGKRGCGKTKLASIIANELAKNGQPVLFSTVPELLDDIRESYGKEGVSTQQVTSSVKNAEVLVLDDLGTERMTAWTSEQLYLIINNRYNKALPTIITTNYDPKTLLKRLVIADNRGKVIDPVPAERLFSRLRAMCEFVEIKGGDRRI